MKIRMKDIAKMANVSEAAVSLVLNDKSSRISEKKKREIKEIAERMNYVPNIAAQSLAKNTSQTIGVVIPDIENPFFSKLCKQLEDQFRKIGYLTIIVNSNDNFSVEKNLVQMLLNRGVDGLIIALSNESFAYKKEQKKFLAAIDRPFVLVDRRVTFENVNQVYFDHLAGGKISAGYLLQKGHRRIAFMTGDLNVPSTLDKIRGYQQALQEYGLKSRKEDLIETGYRFDDGMKQTKNFLSLKETTAVITANDLVAFGVMKQLKHEGYTIPKDFSIIGYDRLELSNFFDVSLTTIEQNSSLLSEQAVLLLKKNLAKQSEETKVITLEPTFFEGESVGKLN